MNLKEACDTVLAMEDIKPVYENGKIVKTFCNIFVSRICELMGDNRFKDLDMTHIILKAQQECLILGAVSATEKALYGDKLILAGWLNTADDPKTPWPEAHSHGAIIYPVPMQLSSSYNCIVPMVANCGSAFGIVRVSQAFKKENEPFYYLLD